MKVKSLAGPVLTCLVGAFSLILDFREGSFPAVMISVRVLGWCGGGGNDRYLEISRVLSAVITSDCPGFLAPSSATSPPLHTRDQPQFHPHQSTSCGNIAEETGGSKLSSRFKILLWSNTGSVLFSILFNRFSDLATSGLYALVFTVIPSIKLLNHS